MGIYEFQPDDAFRFANEIGAKSFQKGDELHFTYCPYCLGGKSKDKNTFSLDLKTGMFKCLRSSCNAHGNMITLSKDFNFSLGSQVDEYYQGYKKFRRIHRKEKPQTKPAAVAYLESRGISEAIANKYNITVQKDNEKILVFPFYDENDVMQFVKYRKTNFDKAVDKNKEWCERDCKPILFGMNQCNFENTTLVLTEGQIDSLSVAEAGIENAVSVPTGAKGFTWIPYCWDFLSRFTTLVVFGDLEGETITLLSEMKKRFNGAVKHVRQEDYQGCKDANEILQKYGKDAVRKAVKNAIPVPVKRIKPLNEVERVNLNNMEKISSGIRSLDRLLGGFYFGQLILLTGERGEGKSTLASQFGSFAVSEGYPVFFYSGELMDWYFKAWFDLQVAGSRHINPLKSNLGYTSYSIDGNYIGQIESWYAGKAFVYDNGIVEEGEEEESILETMEKAIKQYGCRVLVVDNLMTAITDDIASDLYRQQTKFVKNLATLAKRYNVLIFLIAHPRKSVGTEFGNDDIAGSGNITNLVDVVMRYSKPKGDGYDPDTPDRLLTVYKNRLTGVTDRKGILLRYEASSKRISEDRFDWTLGWERDGFVPMGDDEEVVFD